MLAGLNGFPRHLTWVPLLLLAVVLGSVLMTREARGAPHGASLDARPAALPGSTPAPARDRITFYFGLQRPERQAQAAFIGVGDPTSPTYRRFLTLGQASNLYGAGRSTRARFRRILGRHGLRVRFHRSGVFARVRGPVRRLERTFRVRIRRLDSASPPRVSIYWVAGNRPPRLPRGLRPLVREVVATYWRSPGGHASRDARSAAGVTPGGAEVSASAGPGNSGTWVDGCDDARRTGAYSFEQVRRAYGIDSLGPGTGGSVAILNVEEGVTRRDIAAAAHCFGLGDLRTHTLRTDGQARAFGHIPPFSVEPQLDLALVRGMAPGLGSVRFAQVWSPPELWFLGAARVLVARQPPDAFSISYGECERDIRGRRAPRATRVGARLLDSLLVRLALVGVPTFAAAGDFGSTCNGKPLSGVTWPASSPFVTAVGGTRLALDQANARLDEVVWNDLAWLSAADGGGAGGGGLSAVSPRPPFQPGATLPGRRRAVPDVSAHASLFPGWPVVIAGNWLEASGTSAATPLLAGAFAALSARERAAGHPPLGPVNGLLYHLRSASPGVLFDVVAGDNRFLADVPARTAAPGYDLASGVGVVRFDRLAAALPPGP
jgi:hypothetical protein